MDDIGLSDEGQDAEASGAAWAFENIDGKDAKHKGGPVQTASQNHGRCALGRYFSRGNCRRCGLVRGELGRINGHVVVWAAVGGVVVRWGRCDSAPPCVIGSKDAVISSQMFARWWDQGGQSSEECCRLEIHVTVAVWRRAFVLVADLAVGGPRESFHRECGAKAVATQAFESVSVVLCMPTLA